MTTITLRNGEKKEVYPYHQYGESFEDIIIYIYKEYTSDMLDIIHCFPHSQKEKSRIIQGQYELEMRHYDLLMACRYNPEIYVSHKHDAMYHFGTIRISLEDYDHYYTSHQNHSFYFNSHCIMSSGSSNKLIDTYVRAHAELWRMGDFVRNDFSAHNHVSFTIYKVCNGCNGEGKVYYNRGKRIVKKVIKTCPVCKGKNSKEIVL